MNLAYFQKEDTDQLGMYETAKFIQVDDQSSRNKPKVSETEEN